MLLFASMLQAFAVEVSDLENQRLSITYSMKGQTSFDAHYLHQRCFESLEKMNNYYQGFLLRQQGAQEEKSDYVLEVSLSENQKGWTVGYLIRSLWVKGEQSILYQDSFTSLSEQDVLLSTYKLFDQMIEKLNLESPLFEYPVAFIEERGRHNALILSDLLLDYQSVVYETENPLAQICWDRQASSLFFTEITNKGMVLKSLRLDDSSIVEHFTSSLISSMVLSHAGDKLYFIADFTHIPHLYQLNLANGHFKAITSGPQWVSEVATLENSEDLLVTMNRTGNFQVYQLCLDDKKFKKETFTNSFASSGQKKEEELYFLAFDDGDDLSLYQRILVGQKKPLTAGFDVHSFAFSSNHNLLALSISEAGLRQKIALYHKKDQRVIALDSHFPRKNMIFSPIGNLYSIIKK